MDPDSTANSKQILDNYSNDNDFLKALFEPETSTMNSAHSVEEYGGIPVQYPGSHSETNGHTNGHNLLNGHKSFHDELSNRNEVLKQQTKELLEKNILLESHVAEYEVRLSQKMQEILNSRMEMDTLKQSAELNEKEMADAKAKLEELKAQIYQLQELKISKDETDNSVAELQKDLAHKAKIQQKLRNKIENNHVLLTEKNNDIKKAKQNNKKLWNLLTRFGRKLAKADLLTSKERTCIMKEYDEENPISDVDSDDQNEEIVQQMEESAQSVEQSHDAFETTPINSNPFLQPLPVRPSTSNNSEGFHFGQSSKAPRGVSSFNRPRSSSNYFRKTFREVLEDPQVSDDCMDVTVSELSTLRQHLGLDKGHFTPISPIPPTPPPKTNQSVSSQSKPAYAMSNPNDGIAASSQPRNSQCQQSMVGSKMTVKSDACFNRRLAFTHQQSEGFDVAGDSPNILGNEDSQNALPKFSESRNDSQKSSCRVLAKRQNDGCLKLQFNSAKPILFEVNYNTHDVTCTFPPLSNDVPDEENPSYNVPNVSNPTRASSTPFRIHKPVLVQTSLKKEPENTSLPIKRQKLSDDEEPFRVPLNPNDAGNSGFVYYQRSGSPEERSFNTNAEGSSFRTNAEGSLFNSNAEGNSPNTNAEGNSPNTNAEGRSHDTNSPYGAGGLFHHSPPSAFVFETENTANDEYARQRVFTKLDLDGVEKNLVNKEESKSVVSSSCRSPFLLTEQNRDDILLEEQNLLQLQPKQVSPRKSNPAIEAIEASSPNDMINSSFSNFEQQDVPSNVLAQSDNNILPFTTPIFGTVKNHSERSGYTSSESDQCSESSYKPLCKKMGLLNSSTGTLRRRRKRLVNLGESSNVAPVRMKGRTLQSRTYAGKAALDKSYTIAKEQATNGIFGEIDSSETILDGSTEAEINGLDCFSELSVFKVPKRVSRAMQKRHECSVSPISEESLSESGPMDEITTTSVETHAMECSNNIPSSDVETVATPCVEGIDMECSSNQDDAQNNNVNGSLEESMLKKTNGLKTYLKSTRSSVNQNVITSECSGTFEDKSIIGQAFVRKSSTDEVQSDTEHKNEDIPKKKPKNSKSIAAANDIAHICSAELDSKSTSNNQDFMQKMNACETQNEVEHQGIPRRTRSTCSKERESVAEVGAKNKNDCTFVEQEHKQTSCTDNEDNDLGPKTRRNPIRKRHKSTIDGLQVKPISSDEMHDRSDLRAEVQDKLMIENSKLTVSSVNSASGNAETLENFSSSKRKKTIKAKKKSDVDKKEEMFRLFNQSSEVSSEKIEVEKSVNEANLESEKLTVSVSDVTAIENDKIASKENSTNVFEVENGSNDFENSTSHDSVQTLSLSVNYKKVREKIDDKFIQENDNTSSLNATKSGKIDKSSNVAKLESISIAPTKTKLRRSAKKEVLDLHSEIQHQQTTLSPVKKVIKELTTNGTETSSPPKTTSPLQNYKTQCTITKLLKRPDSTSAKTSDTNAETVRNLGKYGNSIFVLNDNCTITSVTTDNDAASSKKCNQYPKVILTPVKIRTSGNNLPIGEKSQDFEMIDFTEMEADSLYPTIETPLNSEFNATSITPIPNIVVKREETNSRNRSPNKSKKELFGKSNKSSPSFNAPTKAKQGLIVLHSMPLSPDPVENKEESSFSGPLSSNAKELTATSDSVLNATGTSTDSSLVMDCKDEDVLTNLNVVEVEVETSPKVIHRTRSKSLLLESPTETVSKPRGVVTSNCCVIDDNSKISEVDSDNDSPLIIAEELLESEPHADPVSDDTSKKSKAMLRKTRKRSQSKLAIRKTRKSSSVENFSSVEAVFQDVEKIKFTDHHFKISIHNLVRVLIDPKHSSDAQQLIFHIVQHLHQTKRSPMLTYSYSHDISTLLPITENCIVSALFQIESKGKPQFYKVLESTVLTLYNMVLGKEKQFSMLGQAALCRVLTEICKRRNIEKEPINLCGELIKWQHQYAPYLIASMVGIWPELFQPVNNLDDEENIFFGAIARGVQDKPDILLNSQWKQCQAIFTNLLSVKPTEDKFIPRTVSLLVRRIRSKCIDSVYDKEYLLSTPMVIYSRIKGWEWARDVLMDTFIVPSLKKFSKEELNEIAFEFFLNLYAEICYSFPLEENPYELLRIYFLTGNEEIDFEHFTAAITMLKLIMWKRDYFSEEISEWMVKWNKHQKVAAIEHLFKRRMMADQEFCITDILEDSQ